MKPITTNSFIKAGFYAIAVGRALFCIALLLAGVAAFAQPSPPPGTGRNNAIDIGSLTPETPFTDTQQVTYGSPYSDSDGIHYKFSLSHESMVDISTCGSGSDTFLVLLELDENGNVVEEDEFDDFGSLCSNVLEASMRRQMFPGSYIAVFSVGAYVPNWYGNIHINISVESVRGGSRKNAIDGGIIDISTPYLHTANNSSANGFTDVMGQPSNDIFYKFMLNRGGLVDISHCSSSIDTYMHLLSSTGSVIAQSDDDGPSCTGTTSSLRMMLGRGVYYVVSEGKGSLTGDITTQITFEETEAVSYGDKNSIVVHSPLREIGQGWELDAVINAKEQVRSVTDYFDGLGRPMQSVQWMASPSGKDIVQHIEYDVGGRRTHEYLPYADGTDGDGMYKPSAKLDQLAYYSASSSWDDHVKRTAHPYAETVFENSPLDRVTEQGATGSAWQPATDRTATGRTVVTDYGSNTENDVHLWVVGSDGADGTGFYPPGRLYKTVTKDENWINTNSDPTQPSRSGILEEYTDIQRRIVLKRVWESESKKLDTYYVYDAIGNLRYIVPPAVTTASFTESDPLFGQYIYAYRYDKRRRVAEKKIPGKGWEYIVYNRGNLPILTQDAMQRALGKWSYTKYNALGNVTETGIHNHTYADQATAQSAADLYEFPWEYRQGAVYTNQAFPDTDLEPLVVNYYDDYDFEGREHLPGQDIAYNAKTRALLTGTKVYRDDGMAPLLTVHYYDDRSRLVQSASQNHLGGTDYVTNTYNFIGELLTSRREHRPALSGAVTTVLTTNNYDHVGRLVETRKKVNSEPEIVQSQLSYNEIGQLKEKKLHGAGSSAVQQVAYHYNERGWLTKINDPETIDENRRFGMTLNYANKPDAFNGNIGSVSWNTKVSGSQTQTPVQSYTYDYDKLNRLQLAAYADAPGIKDGFYDEELEYDDMGNITSLHRTNGSPALYNDFAYTYSGNRLMSVADAGSAGRANSFTYDANGNAKTNNRLGITDIEYNYLNLPKKFVQGSQQLVYAYDATGRKLRKELGSAVTDYVDGIQYKDGVLEFIQTEEGRILPNGSSFIYEYFLKDHLGNTRTVVDHTGSVKQITDYYAFGMEMNPGSGLNSASNHYKYNGKEQQVELGLDQLDYGARFYDAEIGRWNVVDKEAERYERHSPYAYVLNRPTVAVDPDGKRVYFVGGANNDQDGWNYIQRWGNSFRRHGVSDFRRVNMSNGKAADVLFTSRYRDSGHEPVMGYLMGRRVTTGKTRPVQNETINKTVAAYQEDLKKSPLKEGEQFNLAGYSYGSVLQAQAALKLANSGQVIDNLILIGSPISDNSDLYKELSGNKNIKNILRYDLEGDAMSNPQDIYDFMVNGGLIQGGKQGDDARHFDAARPGKEADKLIDTIVQWLRDNGVKN